MYNFTYEKEIIFINNTKYQSFISSTFTELIAERQEAISHILDCGHIPVGMEIFRTGLTKWDTIKKWIDNSDIYLLIFGGRYGDIEEGELAIPKRNTDMQKK